MIDDLARTSEEKKKLGELFDSYAEKIHGQNVVTPEGLAQVMKRIGRSPYLFIKLAWQEYSNNNFYAAKKWINYASEFMDKYFDDQREEENFIAILKMANLFLTVMESSGKN